MIAADSPNHAARAPDPKYCDDEQRTTQCGQQAQRAGQGAVQRAGDRNRQQHRDRRAPRYAGEPYVALSRSSTVEHAAVPIRTPSAGRGPLRGRFPLTQSPHKQMNWRDEVHADAECRREQHPNDHAEVALRPSRPTHTWDRVRAPPPAAKDRDEPHSHDLDARRNRNRVFDQRGHRQQRQTGRHE